MGKLYTFKLYDYATKQDYTNYLVEPIFIDEHLDESLDNALITLDGAPISTKDKFQPSTKLVLERYLICKESKEPDKYYHFVVNHDDVEEYSSVPDICTHRIDCIEVSALAEQYHPDNMALTYRLKDVNLDYTVAMPEGKAQFEHRDASVSDPKYLREEAGFIGTTLYAKQSWQYIWEDYENLKNMKYYYDDSGDLLPITIKIPKLYCYRYNGSNWVEKHRVTTRLSIQGYDIETKVNNFSYIKYCADGNIYNNQSFDDYETNSNSNKYIIKTFKSYYVKDIIEWKYDSVRDKKVISFYEANNSNYITNDTMTFMPTKNTKYIIDINYVQDTSGNIVKPIIYSEAQNLYIYINFGLGVSYSSHITANPNNDGEPYYGETYIKTQFEFKHDNAKAELLRQPVPYNAYDMIRKMILTCQQNKKVKGIDVLNTPAAFYVEEEWFDKLHSTQVNESAFIEKNLWECLIQIGYYIHAIPFIEFGLDDKFVIKFKQLGDINITKQQSPIKMSIFSSRNLNEYFSTYDSYLTNLFSPNNTIDEYLHITSEDESYLVYNDVACAKTTKPILEIKYFGIVRGSDGLEEDMTTWIFEESIYSILKSDYKTTPSKGNCLFYTLGDNIIKGLTYIPPSKNSDRKPAMKWLICKAFKEGFNNSDHPDANIKYNDYYFHIKYATQDSARVKQNRPDIFEFIKNSKYDNFPIHEQFYGQQDKIVDSERLGNNLFGQLIKQGNKYIQHSEYSTVEYEKGAGDLVIIEDESYYVSSTSSEYYGEAIFQKVEYSKDFNRLSQNISIPSEPRFYEVSERSKIPRELFVSDPYYFTKDISSTEENSEYLGNNFGNLVRQLIFKKDTSKTAIPTYAITTFKQDPDGFDTNPRFPSSIDNKVYTQISVRNPIIRYPSQNGLVFEWDMQDNFSAGDFIDTNLETPNGINDDKAYYLRQPMRYVDIYGRADLFQFNLGTISKLSLQDVQKAPQVTEKFSSIVVSPDLLCLKDNRESLGINYEISLGSHDKAIVSYQGIWSEKETELKLAASPVRYSNQDNNSIFINGEDKIDYKDISYTIAGDSYVVVSMIAPSNINLSEIKSLVFYDSTYFNKYIVINFSDDFDNSKKFDGFAIKSGI